MHFPLSMKYGLLFIAGISLISCGFTQDSEEHWKIKRLKLVEELKNDGITDSLTLLAMSAVPRHEFVPKLFRPNSYINRPLPIGHEQTISQPYIVAYMVQELQLKPTDIVLEIGTGSGYHAAVISLVCNYIYSIEIVPELGRQAAILLDTLGYDNILVKIGDGYQGWTEHAPFDAIILTAAPPEIPRPLLEQLKVGGRLIAPVGVNYQELVRVTRTDESYKYEKLIPVMFVPMTGEAQKDR